MQHALNIIFSELWAGLSPYEGRNHFPSSVLQYRREPKLKICRSGDSIEPKIAKGLRCGAPARVF
jgi:hypothetical protein